jgi:hypothetical protein
MATVEPLSPQTSSPKGDGGRQPFGDVRIMRYRVMPLPLVMVTAALVLTGGCGSSKPPVCSDAAAVQTSVNNLKGVSISRGSLSTLNSDVSTIQQQLTTLSKSAKGQFAPQISALRDSLAALRPAVTAATAQPGATTLATVATTTHTVVRAAGSLQSAVNSTC